MIVKMQGSLKKLKDMATYQLHTLYQEQLGPISSRTHRRVLEVALAYHAQVEHYKAAGLEVPAVILERYEAAKKAHTFEQMQAAGLIMMQERKWSGVVESECPAFRRGHNDQTTECQGCLVTFADEYAACKAACEAKAAAKLMAPPTPVVVKTPASVEEVLRKLDVATQAAAVTPSAFKGFRTGSQAAVIKDILEANLGEWLTLKAVADQVIATLHTDPKSTYMNVDSYTSEWSKGKWNMKPVLFGFTIERGNGKIRMCVPA